jgi:predicted ester cyclase
MSTKDLKALERRFAKEWNKGKAAAMAVISETCATNLVFHSGAGEDIRGLKGFKHFINEFYKAFPDNHMTLDDMVVERDKVAVRYTVTGTHTGEYMGIRPTNKKIKMWALEIDRIAGGKFIESWLRFDTIGLMQQLGLRPAPRSIVQP